MATREQVYDAIRNAHNAGDATAVRKLGAYLNTMGAQPPKAPRSRTWRDTASDLVANFADDAAAFAEGAGALVDIPAKALGAALSVGARAVGANNVADNLLRTKGLGDLARVAIPQARNNTIGRGIANGLGGVASGFGVAAGLPRLTTSPVARGVATIMGERPRLQAIAGGAAGAATEAARAVGAPIPVQIGAGILTGAIVPAGADASFNSVKVGLHGFRDRGVREAAARLLQENASDASVAANRLAGARSSVPGVIPTAAEASRDPGLAALQRSLADMSPAGGATVTQRMGDNAIRRAQAVDRALGQGNPAALTAAADRQLQRARLNTETAIGRVAPFVPAEIAGRDARVAPMMLADARSASNRNVGRLFDKVDEGEPFHWGGIDPADVVPRAAAGPSPLAAFQTEAVKGARSALPPSPQTITQFVRARGGIIPRGADQNPTLGGDGTMKTPGTGDLHSSGISSRTAPGVFRREGMTAEQMYKAAREDGFFADDIGELADEGDFRQLIDALADDHGGRPVYRPSDAAAAMDHQAAAENRNFWREVFDKRNLDPTSMDDDQWQGLFDELAPQRSSTAATLDDFDAIPTQGRPLSAYQGALMEMRDRFFGPNGDGAPADVKRLMGDVLAPESVTPGQIQRFSKRAYDMAAGTSDGSVRGYLRSFAKALDNIAMRESPEYRRNDLRAARDARRGMADRFDVGPVSDVLAKDRYGRFEMSDASVPAKLVPQGRAGTTSANQLNAALDPQAAEGIARGEIRRQMDGVGPEGLNQVARRYMDTLRQYPALRTDVQAARETAAFLRSFERSPLGRLAGDGRDPIEAVRQAVEARDGARNLAQLASAVGGDPQALAGLRRALAETITAKAARGGGMIARGGAPVDVPNVGALRKSVENLLLKSAKARSRGAPVLEPAQRQVLLKITAELRRADFATKANRTTNSATARNAAVMGRVMRMALSTAARGKGGPFIDVLLNIAHRADDVRDLTTQAMVDPKLASELLRMRTPREIEAFAARARSFYIGGQAGALGSTNQPPAQAQ